MLPDRRPPWKEFVFSIGTQSVALFLLGWLVILHPQVLVSPSRDYHAIELVSTPVPVNHTPAPVRVLSAPVMAKLAPIQHDALRLPTEVTPKVQDETPVPEVKVAIERPAPLPPATPAIPRQLVKTNVFSTGSSATPTIARAPQQVQTGGFGDPNGIPARDSNGKAAVNIAQLGSFDLPTGPGSGNGTGGARGSRGVVASTGFGGDVATGDGSGRANVTRGTVRQAGFGDSDPAAVSTVKSKPAEVVARVTPAEVLSKPTPVYTEEARKLRVEGEVLLEVVFESSGKLHVNRVIQGLGHGLDDAAIRAAEQIHFKPAMRDGQPADSNAVLHIVFQLA